MWCVSAVEIHDATQRSTQGDFLRALERPRPNDIYTTVVFSEYTEATLRERERKGILGRTIVCRIRGGDKQQDRLYCYREEEEESGATRNELSMVSNREIKCAQKTSKKSVFQAQIRKRLFESAHKLLDATAQSVAPIYDCLKNRFLTQAI